MKLEERFDNLIPIEFGGEMQEPLRTECAQIAENFAIGFAEWLRKNTAQTKGGSYKLFNDFQQYNLSELIQIYKKHYENNQNPI